MLGQHFKFVLSRHPRRSRCERDFGDFEQMVRRRICDPALDFIDKRQRFLPFDECYFVGLAQGRDSFPNPV